MCSVAKHRGAHRCRGTLLMLTSFHFIPAQPSLGRTDHEVITPGKLATRAGAELVSLWVWWRTLSSWHLDVPRVDVWMWGTEQSFQDSWSQVLNHSPVKYLLPQLGNCNRSWEGAIRRTIASNRPWEEGKEAFRKSTNEHTHCTADKLSWRERTNPNTNWVLSFHAEIPPLSQVHCLSDKRQN